MKQRFRTVASFDVAYKADLAKAALEEAGIESVVADREIVSMEWLLGAAVNGVKVQVAEADVDRAEQLLADHFGGDARPVAEGVGDDELTRQALAAGVEEGEEPPPDPTGEPSPDPTPAAESERDQYARRFMLASVFSLVFPLLVVYAFYLGLNAAFGSGPITRTGWRRIGFGLAFGGVLVMAVMLLWMMWN